MNNPCSEPFITYVVYAKHTDRDILLGIATGTIEDIEAFYYSQRGEEGIKIEPLRLQHIPSGLAAVKNTLLANRNVIKQQLADLDKQINELGG